MILQKPKFFLPLGFFLFISYIIFLADTADYNFAFRVVGYIPYGDKICHALLYGTMALLLNYGLSFRRVQLLPHLNVWINKNLLTHIKFKDTLANTPYVGSLLILTFATLEEMSQYYIPSRTFDLWDLLADFIGVVLFSIWKIK